MHRDRTVGELLREWRRRRRLSQLDLAVQADVSSRHISFVETGRTIPSRRMLLHLAQHLDVPLRERNRLLVAAGYAPAYERRPLEDPELAQAYEAIQGVLRGHEPFPAVAVDHHWNVLLSNPAMEIFLDGVDPELLKSPVNMMRLGLDPRGFAPRLQNLGQVRAYLLPRLARQAARTGDPELSALYEELRSYGTEDDPPTAGPTDIAMPIRLQHDGVELSFFSTITTFGAAFDITLEEIAIETLFPADATTTAYLRRPAPLRGSR
ncbi:helix-turn-helix transcriptional regulator [Nonomuraea angiospora]|uniref:helix-turn-helix domain-containing protein n=1 Tax=Nonomuraea angiospora TaxID=46172 RepID=UPI00344D6119